MHWKPKRHRPKWGMTIAQNPKKYGRKPIAFKVCTFPGCGKMKWIKR